jgi:hypothetical protein
MGTNNAINIASQGTVYYNGTGTFSGVDGSTAGKVLTSNGTGVAPSFQAAAATGITTINGDTGSATGSTITFNANSNAGSTVKFTASGSTVDLIDTDANGNIFIGATAGNASITSAANNTGVGKLTFKAITSGGPNTALGYNALPALTIGSSNVAVGDSACATMTTVSSNTGIGSNALLACTGQANTALGAAALSALVGGANNIGIGGNPTAGGNYVGSESNNIVIGNVGVAAESNVIRIGTQGSSTGQQNKCFIAGIQGVTASNPSVVTINTSTAQMGNDTTNFTILSTGLQLKGNNTNTAPPAGFIGEQIRAAATSVSLASTTAKTVTSISLTAGIWDISGVLDVVFTGGATVFTINISTTNNTITGAQGDAYTNIVIAGMGEMSGCIPSYRVSLSGTTTYYLVAQCTFITSGTANGRISATRVG